MPLPNVPSQELLKGKKKAKKIEKTLTDSCRMNVVPPSFKTYYRTFQLM